MVRRMSPSPRVIFLLVLMVGCTGSDRVSESAPRSHGQDAVRPAKTIGLQVGMQAPDLEGRDQDGKAFRLSSLRGNIALIDFWGIWCGWCCDELPHYKELTEHLKGKSFRIVGVNSDTDLEKSRRWFHEHDVSWTNIMDGGTDGPVTKAWLVQEFPTLYLLDATGTIRYAGKELRSLIPVEDTTGKVKIVHKLDADIDTLLSEFPN